MAAAAFLACAANAAPPAKEVASLAWLSGPWISETGAGWTEEHWMAPRGGVMLGLNRSGQGSRATAFEFMRIAAGADGEISYWAAPGGKAPVPFRLVSSTAAEAVFENPRNDYPTRIVYRRAGDTLVGTISGADGAKPYSWNFKRP